MQRYSNKIQGIDVLIQCNAEQKDTNESLNDPMEPRLRPRGARHSMSTSQDKLLDFTKPKPRGVGGFVREVFEKRIAHALPRYSREMQREEVICALDDFFKAYFQGRQACVKEDAPIV